MRIDIAVIATRRLDTDCFTGNPGRTCCVCYAGGACSGLCTSGRTKPDSLRRRGDRRLTKGALLTSVTCSGEWDTVVGADEHLSELLSTNRYMALRILLAPVECRRPFQASPD